MEKGIDYDYVDIMESEENKFEFEEFRRSHEEYNEILQEGTRFGIPVLVYDNDLVMGFDKKAIDSLIAKLK